MSKISSKLFLGVLILFLLSIGTVAVVDASSNDSALVKVFQKYLNKDEKEVKKEISKLTKQELLEEISILTSSPNQNDLIPFFYELVERKDEFSNSELIKSIKDKKQKKATRELMIDTYIMKNEKNKDNSEIKKLLVDPTLDEDLKSRIVAQLNFSSEDEELLTNLFEESDELLAFHSLKRLSKINSEKAAKISEEILASKKTSSPEKLSASLKVMANHYRKNNNSVKSKELIRYSEKIIETSKDEVLKDSAVFAVSDLMNAEAIISLINNENVDRQLKAFSIDQNYMILDDILENSPTELEIEAVIKAMQIYPISDLSINLEKASKSTSNKNLIKEIQDTLDFIEKNGVQANKKWQDRKDGN
ncbi:hypothetical protein [Sutcliffiella horikoshii]|uniref:Uncharacterized protein n=1 Tax=Sutcliffiella horikoshii TaxID=79883 RepID=A0A5D4T9T8_9BACI|nr:hypothetical protein [Sutcliffiella horikoshii]TYS72407.1 hypothetical protein FZC75_10685 [Sutcliffiella horikoshii]